MKSLSCVILFATPWTVAYQASPSMGFSRQDYWSRLPFPSQGDLSDPGIEPRSPALEADALTSEVLSKWKCYLHGSTMRIYDSKMFCCFFGSDLPKATSIGLVTYLVCE